MFRSVTAWEPGTGGKDVETRSSRSHFPHDEMDTVSNSQVRQRTVMASGALSDTEGGMIVDWSRLWLGAASLHGAGESGRLRQLDVVDPPRRLRLPQTNSANS